MSDLEDHDDTDVVGCLEAILAEATIARAILNVGTSSTPFPEGLVEILAQDPRYQKARQLVRDEFSSHAEEGVPFTFRTAIEAAYEGLIVVVIQQVWELRRG